MNECQHVHHTLDFQPEHCAHIGEAMIEMYKSGGVQDLVIQGHEDYATAAEPFESWEEAERWLRKVAAT